MSTKRRWRGRARWRCWAEAWLQGDRDSDAADAARAAALAADAAAANIDLVAIAHEAVEDEPAQVASLTVDDVTWNELHVDEVLADLAARCEEEHHD